MARKKSAAKRAREAEEAQKKQEQEQKTEVEQSVKETVEQEFSSESESSSEDEDDYGELITEDVDQGINQVLEAIKKGDEKLFDSKVRFFGDPEEEAAKIAKEAKHKPIYLKDYHRMNLLAGDVDINEDDAEKPKTYAQEKEEERNELLSEIKDAFNNVDEDDEENSSDDGFLKKKDSKSSKGPKRVLPDPSKDEEQFLKEFANQHAWIPQDGDKILNLDKKGEESDEEFEEAVENFERAYNFRYESKDAAEIVSYARNQATVRRNQTNGRRKKREEEKLEKIKETQEVEKLVNKKKTEKVHKLTDILEQVKKEYGADLDESVVQRLTESLLDKDFDDSQWDNLLAEVFNDKFYEESSEKPTWDDDNDEIMKGYGDDSDQEEDAEEDEEDEVIESEEPPKKKSKKDVLKAKKDKKKDKQAIKELAESAIEKQKLKIIEEVEEEREGRSKDRKHTFKYREVSPESYGLTTRDILLADDSELNEFLGLKKLAPYRTREQKLKDKRKFAKAKHLKEWRKKVYKNKPKVEADEDTGEILIPIEDESKPVAKKAKISRNRKHTSE